MQIGSSKRTMTTGDMIAIRDAARVPIQQAIETISDAVVAEPHGVSSLFVARFRRALTLLLQARDELD